MASSLFNLGSTARVRGQYMLARSQLEQEAGDRFDAAEPLMGLARVAVAQGDLAVARRRSQECLAMLHKLGSQESLAACLEGVGAVLAGQGMPLKAVELWGIAEALREAMGAPMHPVYRGDYEQAVAAARAQLGEEAFSTLWAEGRTIPVEQAITTVFKLGSGEAKQ